jgi:hypothetical protein
MPHFANRAQAHIHFGYPTEFKEQALSKARGRGTKTLQNIADELNLSLGILKN